MNLSGKSENLRNTHTILSARRSLLLHREKQLSQRKMVHSLLQKTAVLFLLSSAVGAFADPTPLPISALPAASTISGADIVPIVQSGTTKKASFTTQQAFWQSLFQPLDGDLTSLSAL